MTDYTIEAEDLNLDGYVAREHDVASDGGYIQSWSGGSASTTFEGEAGRYLIDLTVFDENDGASTVELIVNGEVVAILIMDENAGGGWITDTLTRFSLVEIELAPGDTLEIRSTADEGEPARIDKIDLTAVEAQDIDPALIGETIEVYFEDYDGSVDEGDFNESNDQLTTSGRDDGVYRSELVDMDDLVNGEITLDLGIRKGSFEEWGTNYGDYFSVELIDQNGVIHVLDVYSGAGTTLTGSRSGQTIDNDGMTGIVYEVPPGVTSFTIQLQSDISAAGEVVAIDNVRVTGSELLESQALDAIDDVFTVSESEGAGDVEGNVLANDESDFGPVTTVFSVEGQTANVGEFIELAGGGRVRIDADGNIDFDANGDFDALEDGETAQVSLEYTIAEVTSLPEQYECLFFNDLPAGTIVDDEYAANGVRISSANGANPVMIFDTANPTGQDTDLATSNLGKVLILSEDGNSSDPDDNASGGTFIFEFDRPANVTELRFLDTEEPRPEIRFYDEDGALITTIDGPVTADGGQASANFDVSGVARMEVELQGSGAIDNLVYTLPAVEERVEDTATVTINIEGESDPALTLDAIDDRYVVQETEGAGDVEGNVLDNDVSDFGPVTKVFLVEGQSANIGQFIELADGGRVRIDENGQLDFDADGDFDFLNDGESAEVSLEYTIAEVVSLPESYECLFFNDLPTGAVVTDQFAANGLRVSSANAANPVMVFDSANPTGGDWDLASSNLGKVLILSEDGDSSDPDDNAGGGTFVFDFDRPATLNELSFLDTEEPGAEIRFYDEDGALITTVQGPVTPDGGQASVTFDVSGVSRMEVELQGSGAIDNLVYTFPAVEEIVAEDTATVTIVIEGENDVVVQNPPVAEDDAKTINEDEAIAPGTSQSLNILDNDSDPDGDAISVAAVAGGAVGAAFAVTTAGGVETQVRVDADGEVTFDTAGLFDTLALGDTDSFQLTYTVTDGNGGFDDAVVTITILGLNEPPVATNNANVTDEETAVSGNVLTDDDGFGVDSDPNGDALTVTEVSFGSVGVSTTVTTDSGNFDGELIVNADGTYTFTPGEGFKVLNPGDQETVSFSYTISDGNGGEDTANVVITVNGLNDPPEATDNRAVTDEETAVGGNVLTDDDGFGVDSDPDGDTLTVVGVSFGDVGTTTTVTTDSGEFEGELTVNDDGTYTFVPGTGLEVLNPGEQETVTFTYTVSDGNGGTDTAETIITINGLNEPPVAIDDAITIFEDETVGFDGATLNVLENDSDPDGDPLSVTDVQGAAPGTPVMVTTAGGVDLEVVIQSDGTLQFDPGDALLFLNDGESDSFTVDYTANDGNGGTDDATVTVTIEGKSEGPTTSYNVVFLVDTSLSTGAAGDGSALIGSQGPLDLNGDGIENSVLDAYLNTVQKISDKLGQTIGSDAEAEIGVFGFSTPLEVGEPNERPTALDDGGRTIFEAGEDLSGAFGGAEAANVAAYNTAFSAANEFFDATTANDAANTVNLVFLLSDGFGTEFTAGGDPTLAEELSVLTGTHGATAETFITDPFGTIAPLVNDIENTAGDGVIQVATNEAQVNAFIETIDDNLLV